jgi:hypothetical protein
MAGFLHVMVFLLLAACTSSAPAVIYGTSQQLTLGSVTLTSECLFLSRDPASRAVAQSAPAAAERCSPLNLPSGKYAVRREIDMNFYPEDAIRP